MTVNTNLKEFPYRMGGFHVVPAGKQEGKRGARLLNALRRQDAFSACARGGGIAYLWTVKITVYVTPKPTVLDPQGAAVGHAMEQLGLPPSGPVHVGKTIAFDVEGQDSGAFRQKLDKLCHDLLSNPVIEDYRYEIS